MARFMSETITVATPPVIILPPPLGRTVLCPLYAILTTKQGPFTAVLASSRSMPKRALQLRSPSIALDRTSKIPLSRQIYLVLRNAILEGVYLSHERVPSTRMLSATLGVSRNTVKTVYDQLSAKGYVCGKVGSGTRVAKPIPDTSLRQVHLLDSEGNSFYFFDSNCPTY